MFRCDVQMQHKMAWKYDDLETVTVSFTDFNGTPSLHWLFRQLILLLHFIRFFLGICGIATRVYSTFAFDFCLIENELTLHTGEIYYVGLCVALFFLSSCYTRLPWIQSAWARSRTCMPINLSTTTSSTFDFAHYRRHERQHSLKKKAHSIFAEWLSSWWKRIMAHLTLHWNQFRLSMVLFFVLCQEN